jgi:hypothetical protein
MGRRPNPYRVLAHAIDAGDRRLAALLAARLRTPPPHPAQRLVERLVKALGLD